MVAREIGERGRLETHGGHPMLLDRVRGDFHTHAFGTEVAQRGELPMNAHRIGGRVLRRSELRRYTESQRAHECCTPVADLESLREQPRTRSLAIGPRDPGDGERLRG